MGQGRTYRRAAGEKRQPRGGWFEAIVRSRRNTKGKSPRRRASHVSIAPPWAGKPVPRGTGFPARAFAAVFNKPRCAPRRHSGIATSRPISRTAPALLPSFRRSVPDKFPAPPPSRSSLSAPRWAAPSGPTPNPPSASPSAPPRPSGPAIAAARFRPETRSAKDAHDYRAAESERRDHAPSGQDEVCGLPSHPPGSPKTPSAKPAPSAPPPPRSAPRVRHPRPWHPRSRAPRRCTPPGSPAPTSSPPASASRTSAPRTPAPPTRSFSAPRPSERTRESRRIGPQLETPTVASVRPGNPFPQSRPRELRPRLVAHRRDRQKPASRPRPRQAGGSLTGPPGSHGLVLKRQSPTFCTVGRDPKIGVSTQDHRSQEPAKTRARPAGAGSARALAQKSKGRPVPAHRSPLPAPRARPPAPPPDPTPTVPITHRT